MKGGKRENAGRPRGIASVKSEEARKILAQMVFDEITPLGQQLLKQAKKGNILAMRELFDRAFGRAPQAVEVKGMIAISQLLDQAEKNE